MTTRLGGKRPSFHVMFISSLNIFIGILLILLGTNLAFQSTNYWTDMMIGNISGYAFMELFGRTIMTIGFAAIVVAAVTLVGKKRWVWPATLMTALGTIGFMAMTIDSLNLWGLLPLALSGLVLALLFSRGVRLHFGHELSAATPPRS